MISSYLFLPFESQVQGTSVAIAYRPTDELCHYRQWTFRSGQLFAPVGVELTACTVSLSEPLMN